MSKKIKKIALILTGLVFLAGAAVILFPFVVGMNYGYGATLTEHKIKAHCNCKTVVLDKSYETSESLTENITSGKPFKKFKFVLKDCDYASFTELSQDILAIVKKENLCSNKDIELTVNHSGEERIILIEDCSIKE